MHIPPPDKWDGATARSLLPTLEAELSNLEQQIDSSRGTEDAPRDDLLIRAGWLRQAIARLNDLSVTEWCRQTAREVVEQVMKMLAPPAAPQLACGPDDEL